MANRYVLTLACLLLSGCASAPFPKDGPIAWDGLGPDDNLSAATELHPKTASTSRRDLETKREVMLATLDPRSAEWQALHDQIDADREKRLKAQLRICNGCLPEQGKTADNARSIRSASDTPSSVSR